MTYELLDESNDYAIDAPPSGLELTETDVVVLQDLNQVQDLGEITEVLESAMNDLSTLMRHQIQVSEALHQKKPQQGKAVLIDSIQFRTSLERRYLGRRSAQVATETFHYGYDVLVALEAENEANKNIFQKMIDAIVKAFRWLWDNLKKIFGKTLPDESEKRTKQKDKIKKAEEKGIKPKPDTFESAKLATYFPEFTGTISPEDVLKKIEASSANLEKLEKLRFPFQYCLAACKDIALSLEDHETKREYNTLMEDVYKKTEEGFKDIPTISKDALKGYDIEIPESVRPETIRAFTDFLKNGKLVFWITKESNLQHPKSKLVTQKPSGDSVTFKVASAAQMEKIAEAAAKMNELYEKIGKTYIEIGKLGEDVLNRQLVPGLEAAVKFLNDMNHSTEEKTNVRFGFHVLKSYAGDAGSLITNANAAIQLANYASHLATIYGQLSSEAYTDEPAKEEAKTEEKKEDEKKA